MDQFWDPPATQLGRNIAKAGGSIRPPLISPYGTAEVARPGPGRPGFSRLNYYQRVRPWPALDLERAAAGTSAIAGTSNVVFANTATLLGRGALAGVAAQTFSNTAALTGKGALAGTSLPAFTNTAILAGKGALAGIAAQTFVNTAALLGKGALVGSAVQAFADTATLVGRGALAGVAAEVFANTATLAGRGALAGTANLVFTNQGDLQAAVVGLTGSAPLTFTNTATLLGRGALAGTAAQAFSNSAALFGRAAAAGSIDVSFAQTGVLTGRGALAGAASLAFSTAGSLEIFLPPVATTGPTSRQHLRFSRNADHVLTGRSMASASRPEFAVVTSASFTASGTKAFSRSLGWQPSAGASYRLRGVSLRAAGTSTLAKPSRASVRTSVGKVHPVGVENPSDRELATIAMTLVQQRRQRKRFAKPVAYR